MAWDFAITLGIGTIVGLIVTLLKVWRKKKTANLESGKSIAKVFLGALRSEIKKHMEQFIDDKLEELRKTYTGSESEKDVDGGP
jgi:uncharacterized membrane-anchored protein YhcB (DUF1043 family)